MSERTVPDYLTLNDDYSVTVKLSRPYDENGVKKESITLREPTAREQRQFSPASDKVSPAQLGALEEKMLASLADGVTPEFLGNLAMRDYGRVQTAFSFFTD
ncbi:MAG: phage tail assembly protein [Bombella apis]|uniref:phage tail assembly protein n=1 Tax=Bombella apis TaxID=1785988 RepID=UPI0023F37208|nr:phage tail assembly protein [Bombella apis]MCT6819476.1 phage tail assembly protein [Bombella apis]